MKWTAKMRVRRVDTSWACFLVIQTGSGGDEYPLRWYSTRPAASRIAKRIARILGGIEVEVEP